MEEFLNMDFIQLKPEYIKIILFIWNIIKCTFLLVVCVKLLRWFCDKLFKNLVSKLDSQERKQQLLTLKAILVHGLEFVIFAIYLMNMLFIFGIDVRPLLATAGVLGVAVGFGAKRFVEDIITGIIILIEGQIRVGDYVEIHGMSGFVEKITLTLITVRSDKTGAVNFIRCGYVDSIINHTMQYAYAFFPIDVAYKENVENVTRVIYEAFNILKGDKECAKLILDNIEIFGLDEFKESSLCIKCRIKTKPKGQWYIKRNFNRILKERFDIEGIEIPFNQVVVTNAGA